MPKVCICFVGYNSEVAERSFLNRMANYMVSGPKNKEPKIHCELVFPTTDSTNEYIQGYSCSIYYKDTVFWHKKKFSGKYWAFRSIDVSEGQYAAMQQFCKLHEGEHFNYIGYYAKALPSFISKRFRWYTSKGKRSWYCSEIVTAALKAGRVLDIDECISVHPNELYNTLFSRTYADCQRTNGAKNVRL